jgi:hypothetical protein
MNMPLWLIRLRARWRILRSHGHHLNRRAEVETVLLNVAKGKRKALTQTECFELALKLGEPWR